MLQYEWTYLYICTSVISLNYLSINCKVGRGPLNCYVPRNAPYPPRLVYRFAFVKKPIVHSIEARHNKQDCEYSEILTFNESPNFNQNHVNEFRNGIVAKI